MSELPLLMALRVQGIVAPERAAAALGIEEAEARRRLSAAAAAGLAEERSGRIAGYTLTAEGNGKLDRLLEAEGLRNEPELKDAYDRFMMHNGRVLKVSSDWQVRRDGRVEEPNDHSDEDYDHGVIDRLHALHDGIKVVLGKLACCAERFAAYERRLDDCIDRLLKGDRTAFTAPMAESYHTVWFELHQDLLLTLGLEREA